jgi:predicted O-methyltransferase YrrM
VIWGKNLKYDVVHLPGESNPAQSNGPRDLTFLRHPVCAWLGLRPPLAQHTAAEHAAFRRWAAGRNTLVEIGVAEGVSALALREGMKEDGVLYLIDPFHLSRVPMLNFMKRAARKTVGGCARGKTIWIEEFSQDASKRWKEPIDLIVIDGDHSEAGVERDWNDWSLFVAPGGVVVFHDARIFDGGWTSPEYGPVKLIDRLFRNGNNPGWKIVEEVHSLVIVERGR